GGEKVEIDTKEKDVQRELVNPKTIERKKYLLNVMMNVDVDEIAAKVAAQYFFRLAVRDSERIHPISAQWKQSLKRAGGIVFLPRRVLQVGAKDTAR
ncbi:MAG: hypothetical protein KAW09_05955, partial [Thermoplasmata archaeon]|nr:hypothetical protein [Thermoplasmata archaeon]